MTNQEVARSFANGTGTSGTNPAKSLYWSGDTIYSYGYHHVIARIDRDAKTASINRGKYSVTTSKQTTLVIGELIKAGYTIEDMPEVPRKEITSWYPYKLPHKH